MPEGLNINNITIRIEKKEEYREVEKLVRESFWNVYRPGCLEHYVLKRLREDPDFVAELDFVMLEDGKLIGQNIFMKAVIKADDGRDIPIMTIQEMSGVSQNVVSKIINQLVELKVIVPDSTIMKKGFRYQKIYEVFVGTREL